MLCARAEQSEPDARGLLFGPADLEVQASGAKKRVAGANFCVGPRPIKPLMPSTSK